MEPSILASSGQVNFVELLHQEFLATKGYGAYAFLSPAAIPPLFKQYLNQQNSEHDFIRSYVRKYR